MVSEKLFDQMGIAIPTTWDEVRAMGTAFTHKNRDVWASEDGLVKGGYMNVYLANKVAFIRQWPFFYDISHSPENAAWYVEEKAAIALPPVGLGGKQNSTYAASWGFGIVKTAPERDAAKEVFKFLISREAAVEMALISVWYVSARKSILAVMRDNGVASMMNMYTNGGVIGVRPFHPRYFETITVLEDAAAAYLTRQITLDQSMKQAKKQLAKLSQ